MNMHISTAQTFHLSILLNLLIYKPLEINNLSLGDMNIHWVDEIIRLDDSRMKGLFRH